MRQEVFDDRSVIADLGVWCPNYCRSLFSLQALRLVPDLLILRERFLKCSPMEPRLNGLHHRVGLLPEFDQITAGLNVRLLNVMNASEEIVWLRKNVLAKGPKDNPPYADAAKRLAELYAQNYPGVEEQD